VIQVFNDIGGMLEFQGKLEVLRKNLEIRDRLSALCESMHPSLEQMAEKSVPTLLDEWQAKQDASDFTLLLDLSAECRSLGDSGALRLAFDDAAEIMRVKVFESGAAVSENLYDNECSDISTLVDRFLDLPVLTTIKNKVSKAATDVIGAAFASCELDALLAPAEQKQSAEHTTVPEFVAAIVKPKLSTSTSRSARDFFLVDGHSLASAVSGELAADILKLESTSVKLPEVMATGSPSLLPSSCIQLLVLYQLVNGVIAGFLFLLSEVGAQTTNFVQSDRMLKQSVLAALQHIEKQRAAAVDKLASVRQGLAHEAATVQFTVTLDFIELWLASVPGIWFGIKRLTMQSLVQEVQSAANQVEASTPNFSHYVNDKVFNKSLAKRHLVSSNTKDTLSALVVRLFRCTEQISSFHVMMALPNPVDAKETSEMMKACKLVYSGAMQALTVCAGCKTLLLNKGDALKTEAGAFIDKFKGKLPVALQKELEEASKK
jgi:hypothetical protein